MDNFFFDNHGADNGELVEWPARLAIRWLAERCGLSVAPRARFT